MSRYLNVETVSFSHPDGKTYPVKDIRPIPEQTIIFDIDINEGATLDEVASRSSVYGDNGEIQSYKIFDANIVELTELNFELTNIKKVKIPS